MDTRSHTFQEIHVRLMDERLEVFRSTKAVDTGSGTFLLFPTPDFDPTDEHWEFLPGSTVGVQESVLYSGVTSVPALIAVSLTP